MLIQITPYNSERSFFGTSKSFAVIEESIFFKVILLILPLDKPINKNYSYKWMAEISSYNS